MNHSEINKLSGTQTEKNLLQAASGESAAHTKYDLYAGAAYEEGLATVGDSLWNLSHQEKEHAEIFYGYLGKIGTTKENLGSAIQSETYEAESAYPEYARIAEEEGFPEIAEKFRLIADIERNHGDIIKNTLTAADDGTLYDGAPDTAVWICTNCGYLHTGSSAPEVCPVCSYPVGYFLRYDES